jgi:hypothetical protein
MAGRRYVRLSGTRHKAAQNDEIHPALKQSKTMIFIPHDSIALACDTLKLLAFLDGHMAA